MKLLRVGQPGAEVPAILDAAGRIRSLQGIVPDIAGQTLTPEGLARLLMTRLGVLDSFGALIGADTLPVRKPDPEPLRAAVRDAGGDPARCLLVGDTVTDRETARAAGVPSVLVTFGPDGASVADLEPEALIGHFDELPAVVRQLLA